MFQKDAIVRLLRDNDPSTVNLLKEQLVESGNLWTRVFDAPSRTWTTTSPVGRRSYISLDAKGHLASAQIDGLSPIEVAYDLHGRPLTISRGSRVRTLDYGPDGLVSSTTNPLGLSTHLIRDAAGRIMTSIGADQSETNFEYDANGNVKQLHAIRVGPPPKFEVMPGTELTMDVDLVLLALGFTGPVKQGMIEELGVNLDARSNIATGTDYMSSVPGVFAAGDMRRGQSLVVWAISEGRKAAISIDKYLMGSSNLG